MQIRDILNKILWDSAYSLKKPQIFIQYTHRGAPNDHLIVSCDHLYKVHSDSFEYENIETGETLRIPFHRIEKIFNYQTNEILYKKRV